VWTAVDTVVMHDVEVDMCSVGVDGTIEECVGQGPVEVKVETRGIGGGTGGVEAPGVVRTLRSHLPGLAPPEGKCVVSVVKTQDRPDGLEVAVKAGVASSAHCQGSQPGDVTTEERAANTGSRCVDKAVIDDGKVLPGGGTCRGWT
jgi:hypothetical protein